MTMLIIVLLFLSFINCDDKVAKSYVFKNEKLKCVGGSAENWSNTIQIIRCFYGKYGEYVNCEPSKAWMCNMTLLDILEIKNPVISCDESFKNYTSNRIKCIFEYSLDYTLGYCIKSFNKEPIERIGKHKEFISKFEWISSPEMVKKFLSIVCLLFFMFGMPSILAGRCVPIYIIM